MGTLTWELLTEVYGSLEAELIKSMLNANGIEVELFQETVGSNIGYPTNIGLVARVQVFVSKKNIKIARELLETIHQLSQDDQ
jgi:hypothetical protein